MARLRSPVGQWTFGLPSSAATSCEVSVFGSRRGFFGRFGALTGGDYRVTFRRTLSWRAISRDYPTLRMKWYVNAGRWPAAARIVTCIQPTPQALRAAVNQPGGSPVKMLCDAVIIVEYGTATSMCFSTHVHCEDDAPLCTQLWSKLASKLSG